MTSPLVALSIAGTDSGGAAGLAADLATFAALGAHGACAVTAVTAQDTTGVHRVLRVPVGDVRAQVSAVLDDLPVAVVKTGMLGAPEVAVAVAELVGDLPLVVDPVLVATSGAILAQADVVDAYRDVLLPRATVVTPNRQEAARLTGLGVRTETEYLARAVHDLGPAVVLTGGGTNARTCRDLVVDADGRTTELAHPTIVTSNDHGTGCTFSAALAVHLARGSSLACAARASQELVADALRTSSTWDLGRGRGPVAHVFDPTTKE